MLIVGTRAHLEDLERSYTYAQDTAVSALAVGRHFGGVGSLLPGAARPSWALLDSERIVSLGEFDISPVATLPEPGGQSMAAAGDGTLLIGLPGAHLLSVSPEGEVTRLDSFDQVAGRDAWTNPAGPSPDLRSLAVSGDDMWYANVHVGGLWRTRDRAKTWECVVPADSDVHEVTVGADGVVAVAAAVGFGWSTDGGQSWNWSTDGLHSSYARAVALDGSTAFVTASTGPETNDGRLYKSRLGEAFEQCLQGLPSSFPFNLDSGTLAAANGHVAFGTHDGRVFLSRDGGTTFEVAAQQMRPVTALRFS